MSAIDKLESDHREVEELFSELENAEMGDHKRELFEEIADKLAVHAAIEENHFYPAAKAHATEELLAQAAEEHLSVKRLIADLLRLDPEDDSFDPKVRVLQDQVNHHVQEEENELFPKVKKLLDPATLNAIEQEMIAMEEAMLEEGDPRNEVLNETEAAALI